MTNEKKCFSSKQVIFVTAALLEMSFEIRLQQLRALFASLL